MRGIAIVLLACSIGACSSEAPKGAGNEARMQTLKHPNGLTVTIDVNGTTATQADSGYDFVEAAADQRRTAWNAQLRLEPGSAPSSGAWPDRRTLSGRAVHSRIEQRPGGSGGDLFKLTAWMACQDRHLLLAFEAQGETRTEALFEPAWALLASAACPS